MANGRNRSRTGDSGRDLGGFVALPWAVLDCPAYASLSHAARALLLEVARQFVRDNNGRMLLSTAYMRTRGWLSAGAIQKAKQELLDAQFIFQTVQGQRPNKAGWYAVTWRHLDKIPGYDMGAEQLFERGAYRKTSAKAKRAAPACSKPKKNGASLIPVHGIEGPAIVPTHGIEKAPPIPPHGTMEALLGTLSIPPHGNHLEMPSVGVGMQAVQTAQPRKPARRPSPAKLGPQVH